MPELVRGEIKINVQGGKYVVMMVRGSSQYPAKNWKKLSADARLAVLAHPGGTVRHGGLYPCPESLARQAICSM